MIVRQQGVTLVELVVVLAVLAIVASIAMPAFGPMLRSNRLSVATNELVASVALARGEAIRNTRRAGLCASGDGASCGSDWNQGWLVWSDRDGDGAIGADEVVRWSQARSRMQVSGPAAPVMFDAQGRASEVAVLTLQPEDCAGDNLRRSLRIASTGHLHKAPVLEACQ